MSKHSDLDRFFKVARWLLAVSFFIFGRFTLHNEVAPWILISNVLFLLPLALQVFNSPGIQSAGIWLGAFLVMQSVLSVKLAVNDYITLPPQLSRSFVVTAGLPGIAGPQQVTTDEQGFRTTKEIDYSSAQTLRIFTVGASTTASILLDDRKTWSHLLQERLDSDYPVGVEVVNTGVSGLRARHHLATLKNIQSLQPDIVVFLLGLNDWVHHIRQSNSAFSSEGGVEERNRWRLSESLLFRGKEVLDIADFGVEADTGNVYQETGAFYKDLRGSLSRELVVDFKPKNVDPSYAKYLEKIGSLCDKRPIECVFVTHASGYSLEADTEFIRGFWMTPP